MILTTVILLIIKLTSYIITDNLLANNFRFKFLNHIIHGKEKIKERRGSPL